MGHASTVAITMSFGTSSYKETATVENNSFIIDIAWAMQLFFSVHTGRLYTPVAQYTSTLVLATDS